MSVCVCVCLCLGEQGCRTRRQRCLRIFPLQQQQHKKTTNNVSKAAAAAKSVDRGVLYNYSTMLLREIIPLVIYHTTPRQDQTLSSWKLCLLLHLNVKKKFNTSIEVQKKKKKCFRTHSAFFPLCGIKNTLGHKCATFY